MDPLSEILGEILGHHVYIGCSGESWTKGIEVCLTVLWSCYPCTIIALSFNRPIRHDNKVLWCCSRFTCNIYCMFFLMTSVQCFFFQRLLLQSQRFWRARFLLFTQCKALLAEWGATIQVVSILLQFSLETVVVSSGSDLCG